MTPLLLDAAAALAAWAGMAALCFQLPVQRERLRLAEQSRMRRLQYIVAGSALLVLSLAAAIVANGLSFGIVLWVSQLSVLGLVLVCCVPYRPANVMSLARLSACVAPLLLAAGLW